VLAVPAAAHAQGDGWYVSKRDAQRLTKGIAEREYGVRGINVAARCRPQGQRYRPGYDYHRWVCGWAWLSSDQSELCSGAIIMAGRSDGGLNWRVMRGMRGGDA
jgi:hypothetical protein